MRSAVEHPDRLLTRSQRGGFEIEAAGQPTLRGEPDGDGWRIEGGKGQQGWVLQRNTSEARGFVLIRAEDRSEAGRTMAPVGAVRDAGPSFVLLDDGRLFRIVLRGPRESKFELAGWETPGAYLTARPEAKGWTIAATPAAGGLADWTAVCLLFAAEILDAEQPLYSEGT